MAHNIHRGRAGILSLAAILAAYPAFAVTPDNYIGGDGGSWSVPGNWSAGAPLLGPFDVTINNGFPITGNLDTNATINSISLFAPDTLAILAGKSLTIGGSSSTNAGTINLSGINSSLLFASNATLSGAGAILMNSSSSAISGGTSNNRLVTDNLIMGQGSIGNTFTKITNNGTITASLGTLTLQTPNTSDAIINAGVFSAVGGTFVIPTTGTLTNFGGIVLANGTMSAPSIVNNGMVQLSAGSSLSVTSFSGTGTIAVRDSTLDIGSALALPASFTATHSTLTFGTTSSPALIPFNSNIVNLRNGSVLDFANSSLIISGTSSALNMQENVTLKNVSLGTRDGASMTMAESKINNSAISYFENVTLNDVTIHLSIQRISITSTTSTLLPGQLIGTGTIVFDAPPLPPYLAGYYANVDTLALRPNTMDFPLEEGGGAFTLLGPNVKVVTGTFGGAVSVVTNQGLISAQTPGTLIYLTAGLNSGTVQAINNATLSFYGFATASGITNNGTIAADGGTVLIKGYQNITGTIEASNGGILSFLNHPITGVGSITLTSPLLLADSTAIFSASYQSVASIAGNGTIVVSSAKPLISDGVLAANLSIAGTHTIRANNATTGTSKVNSLAITNTLRSFTGKLDINNNKFILQTDPLTPGDKNNQLYFLGSALFSGHHNGDWLGMGITSSTVAADNSDTGSHLTTLALYDNADLNLDTFGGLPADSNSLFITTALIADSNLDGTIDQTDFTNWYANAMTYSWSTTRGDFNGDGAVDGLDFDLWFTHAANAPAILAGLGLDHDTLSALRLAPVPEPASVVLLTPLLLLLRKRRSRQ